MVTNPLKGVLYVPHLNSNLLNVGQFQREGYSLVLSILSCVVYSDTSIKNLLFKLPMTKNNIFHLYLNGEQHTFKASLEDKNWLSHHRYGH